jgi:hypothetical protein
MKPLRALRWMTAVATVLVFVFLPGSESDAADLKVLKTGLGSGTVTSNPAGINCGTGTGCNATFGSVSVTLTATPDAVSTFAGWDQDVTPDTTTTADCTGTSPTCVLSMSVARSVRPKFNLAAGINPLTSLTPEAIETYLANTNNSNVNSSARFIAALPAEFKQNWILMSRSESLQTGTATSPRILLPSADTRAVFTIALTTNSSYPFAHPNAIEYMQWDATQKNFRFHEIVLDFINPVLNPGDLGYLPARNRGISKDDARCFQCHSTRNVLNRSTFPGTTGDPVGLVKFKSKPNWDTYDSWGGMLPFNRDRIYQGSVEAAAFRKLFNPWTWRDTDSIRAVMEQLNLQPPGVVASDSITRMRGGVNDGLVKFAFDPATPPPVEPAPTSAPNYPLEPPISIAYSFDGAHGTGSATTVTRGGQFVHLRHTSNVASDYAAVGPGGIEGRGVQLFDTLGGFDGSLNAQRIVDELISHKYATGSVAVDVRPLALALTRLDTDGQTCIRISGGAIATLSSSISIPVLDFLLARNGNMTIAQVFADTETRWSTSAPGTRETRSPSMPRRKADIQKFNLDRTNDFYVVGGGAENGLLQEYGAATTVNPADTLLDRIRKEVFRRPNDLGDPDGTVMNNSAGQGFYVDRESYLYNTKRVALYRYFLEPLGVSVDKWAMGVRGRSRTYTFADVFSTYTPGVFQIELEASLTSDPIPGLSPPFSCSALINAVNTSLASFPARVNEVPTFTDVQRIFNKSCIECHGGLGYPPYGRRYLNFSEDENPPATPAPPSPRLARSHFIALSKVNTDPATSRLYQKITETSEACSPLSSVGMMPCGGPPLSKVDIETIRRWIVGPPSAPFTIGDPHIKTVDGVNYDFQSAGEFVLLRNESLEVQARQAAISTDGPLGADAHTGLVSCASLNSAAAVRVGPHRITYQPNLSGRPDPEGLQLRVDGKLTRMGPQGILLGSGGRIVATTAPGGIQIEAPGGAVIVITPAWWDHYQVWYLNIDARHTRATEGVMGVIAPGSWLPALPGGASLGPRPRDLHQRYLDVYVRFEDAWRVTDATSLFDYAPGTSTNTFTIRDWPAENPQSCIVPVQRQPGGPMVKPPLKRLPPEVAERHCAAIVAADRKTSCLQDVMTTGEPGFARAYFLSEQIVRNAPPSAPVLTFPQDNAVLTGPVDFTWNIAPDADGDIVTYRHCIWDTTDRPTFSHCDMAPIKVGKLSGVLKYILLILLILVLVLVLWFFTGTLRALVVIVLAALLVVIFWVGIGAKSVTKSVPELQAGKAYNWRVFAEDGKGGTTESETRRFTIN